MTNLALLNPRVEQGNTAHFHIGSVFRYNCQVVRNSCSRNLPINCGQGFA